MRCCFAPANSVLCNECEKQVKQEYQEAVEQLSKYIDKMELIDDSTER